MVAFFLAITCEPLETPLELVEGGGFRLQFCVAAGGASMNGCFLFLVYMTPWLSVIVRSQFKKMTQNTLSSTREEGDLC